MMNFYYFNVIKYDDEGKVAEKHEYECLAFSVEEAYSKCDEHCYQLYDGNGGGYDFYQI